MTASISRRRSREFVGVRIFLSDSSIDVCILACMPVVNGSVNVHQSYGRTNFQNCRS